MYKIMMLKSALKSYEQIIRYLAFQLKNPGAARSLMEKVDEGLGSVAAFPYSCPSFRAAALMKHEYRTLRVNNYIVLYWVNEAEKAVMVEQIVYARRDIEGMMDDE